MKASFNLSFCVVQNDVIHVNNILVFSKSTVNVHVLMKQRYRESIHQSLYVNILSKHIINVC